MSHSIVSVRVKAPNVTMRMIQPGESLVYKFTADHRASSCTHCGTAPVLEHISMGMCRAIIIDPPNTADRSRVRDGPVRALPRGRQTSRRLHKLLNEQYDAVVFNGYVARYTDRPIQVGVNQKIRVGVVATDRRTSHRSM